MEFDAETLKRQIPFYLTAQDRSELVRELKAIGNGEQAEYLLSSYHDEFKDQMLQGDGWSGFQMFVFNSGTLRAIRGLVLSNSCDISPDNPRDLPARIVFAPLVKLSVFEALLKTSGITEGKIREKMESIRAQKTTNVFFLPAGEFLPEDYVVRLDEVYSMPVAAHRKSTGAGKLFTLNNTGFYMLVLKLSIHFCRFHEGINRRPSEKAA